LKNSGACDNDLITMIGMSSPLASLPAANSIRLRAHQVMGTG
jgi:hypothetical protein